MKYHHLKIFRLFLWLLLLSCQPVVASLTADHFLSITTGLNQPTDIAISDQGNIYVLNGVLGQVVVFSENGKRQFSFARPGKGRGELNLPMGISINNKQLYIADTGNSRISIFDLQGVFIRHLNLYAEKPVAPVSLLVDEGRIIWSDRRNHQLCISQISSEKTLNCWGKKGEADAEFNYPYQLASDEQGYIFAVDVLNARVQGFTKKGLHYTNIGRFGVNIRGALFRPNGLALYKNELLLVSDAYLGTISVFKNAKTLGLLKNNKAKVLRFKSATSLSLYKNKLYVTDTLNNRLEIFKLTITSEKEPEIVDQLASEKSKNMSRKNCNSCHISWAEAYLDKDKNGNKLLPVADQAMCYSCHHGVVIDSRNDIGHKQQHPDNHHMRDEERPLKKNKDTIAKQFPVISTGENGNATLYCGSCHTPHKLKTDVSVGVKNAHNNSWMRESNKQGGICEQCHASKLNQLEYKKTEQKVLNHPLGIFLKTPISSIQGKAADVYAKDKNLHKGLPQSMLSAGAKLNVKQQMICQSCHKVHGSDEESLSVIKNNAAEMCQQCHSRHTAKDIKSARKKGVHPVNIELKDPVKIKAKEVKFMTCLTCHSPHNGKPGTPLLVMDNKNGELCDVCHEDYKKLVNTDHDLRLSAAKSKNRYKKTADESGVCGACHRLHGAEKDKFALDASLKKPYKGEEKPLKADQICLNCHQKDGLEEVSQITYFSHPDKDLILRSDKHNMPLLNSNNEISKFGKIGCITCHNPHRWSAYTELENHAINSNKTDISGDILSSFLRNKELEKSFCKDCHGLETRVKYKYYHQKLSRH